MTDFESRLPELIDALATHGWVVCDDFLPPDAVQALRTEAARRQAAGEFHRAAVGRANSQQVRDDVRGDAVRWLDPHAPTEAEQRYWARIESIKDSLNRELFMGIREGEFHYAHYPVGAFYQRHLDRFRDDDARTVSVVCYLNDNWSPADGGALRIWLSGDGQSNPHDIEPAAGRLVLFLSDRYWHEVLPARRERWSLTGWMRR